MNQTLQNVTFVSNTNVYGVKSGDNILNVDSSFGPITIVLPNIINSGLDYQSKVISINDVGGMAGVNPITIIASSNTVNGGQSSGINVNFGTAQAIPSGQSQWIVNLSTDNSKGSISGSGASPQIAVWSGTTNIVGFSALTGNTYGLGVGTNASLSNRVNVQVNQAAGYYRIYNSAASGTAGSYAHAGYIMTNDVGNSAGFTINSSTGYAVSNNVLLQDSATILQSQGGPLSLYANNGTIGEILFSTDANGYENWRIDQYGNLTNIQNDGSAQIHLRAVTPLAGTSPIKLTNGTNLLTTTETGVFEYSNNVLYFTPNTSRYKFAYLDGGQTFTSATWNGSVITTQYGGTGLSSYTANGIIYASATNTLSQLPTGTTGQMLVSQGAGAPPQWVSVTTGGTVTAFSFTNSNGFTGVVTNPSTTPNLTLSTSVSGVIKGSSGALVAATNSDITGFGLTGFVSGPGTVTSADTILTAFEKINGNVALLSGALIYKGMWNASTNTPTLTSGTGTSGYVYIVSVAGSTNLDGITEWNVGDWAVFNGTVWQRIAGTPTNVVSVFGRVGVVTANGSDYSGIAMTGVSSYNGMVVTANTGVITTATWNGTAVGPTYGGTGQTTYTTGDILYSSATNTLSKLAIGSTGQVLTVSGGVPTWAAVTAGTVTSVSVNTNQGVSGTVTNPTTTPAITLSLGALTGVTSVNGLVITSNTGVITTGTWNGTAIANAYLANSSITINGNTVSLGGSTTITASTPNNLSVDNSTLQFSTGTTWNGSAANTISVKNLGITNAQIANSTIDLTAKVTNALPIANAGTNITTYTTGDVLYASATNVLSKLGIGSTGQVLTVSSGVPAWVNASANAWGLTGNAGTTAGTNFIGTTDAIDLVFKVNNIESGRIDQINYNTSFGYGINWTSITGGSNSAFGKAAGRSITSGAYNSLFGQDAGQGNLTNSQISAFGFQSLYNSIADNNSGFGYKTLYTTTTGNQNSAFGSYALVFNITGSNNSAFGYNSLKNQTGSYNTSLGANTGSGTYPSINNSIMLGYNTYVTGSNMGNISDGSGVGSGTLLLGINQPTPTAALHVTGKASTNMFRVESNSNALAFLINSSGQMQYTYGSPTSGYVLTSDASGNATWTAASANAWGLNGNSGTTAGTNFIGTTDNVDLVFKVNNVLAGYINYARGSVQFGYNSNSSLSNALNGFDNTGFGWGALYSNNGGNRNTAVGSAAGYSLTTGSSNTFVGDIAGQNAVGSNNTGIGQGALQYCSGNYNTQIGVGSISSTFSGNENFIGGYTGSGNTLTTASANVLIGNYSNGLLTSGYNNTIIGHQRYSGFWTTAYQNSFLGKDIGATLTTGYNNVLIGYKANVGTGSTNNSIAIGNNTTISINNGGNISDGSNTLKMGINQSSPNAAIHVTGTNTTGTYTAIFANSAGTQRLSVTDDGHIGINIAAGSSTAYLHIAGGTAIAGTAPLKFNSGTNLTSVEAGAMEYDGTNLYFSPSSSRYTVAYINGGQTFTSATWNGTAIGPTYGGTGQTTYTTGDMLYASGTNALSKLAIGSTGQVLTVSGGVPTWATASGGVWSLTGNSGTTAGTNFIGTTDVTNLVFKTNNTLSGSIDNVNDNTSFGYYTLYNNTSGTGKYNSAFGYQSLQANTTGTYNVSVGYNSLYVSSNASYNTMVGAMAGQNVTGAANTGIGYKAFYNIATSGTNNIAIGNQAGEFTSGSGNINIGAYTFVGQSGNYNIGIGNYANLVTGAATGTTLLGGYSGYPAGNITGNYNTLIGYNVASTNLSTGTNNIFIGPNTDTSVGNGTITNSIVIGYGTTVGTSNTTIIGNTSTTQFQFYGALMPYYSSAFNAGTSGNVLVSQGAGVAPQWSSVPNPNLTATSLLGSSIKAMPIGMTPPMVNSSVTASSGYAYIIGVYLPTASTLTGVKYNCFQAASGSSTTNYCGVALYSYSAGTLTLQAYSTTGTSWIANSGNQSFTFSGLNNYNSSAAPAGIYYIVFYMAGSMGSGPFKFASATNYDTGLSVLDYTNNSFAEARLNTFSGATPPTTITSATSGYAATTNGIWATLY